MTFYGRTGDEIVLIRQPRNTTERQADLAFALMALSITNPDDVEKIDAVEAILGGDIVDPPEPEPEWPKRYKVVSKYGINIRMSPYGADIGDLAFGAVVDGYAIQSAANESEWLKVSDYQNKWACIREGASVYMEQV